MTTHFIADRGSTYGALKTVQAPRVEINWDELGALFYEELSSPDQASFLACAAVAFTEAGHDGLMQVQYIADQVLDSQREKVADFYADLAEVIRHGKQVRS